MLAAGGPTLFRFIVTAMTLPTLSSCGPSAKALIPFGFSKGKEGNSPGHRGQFLRLPTAPASTPGKTRPKDPAACRAVPKHTWKELTCIRGTPHAPANDGLGYWLMPQGKRRCYLSNDTAGTCNAGRVAAAEGVVSLRVHPSTHHALDRKQLARNQAYPWHSSASRHCICVVRLRLNVRAIKQLRGKR